MTNEEFNNRIQTMDAVEWAKLFCEVAPPTDFETMVGWFANAIMKGYDTAKNEALKSTDLTVKGAFELAFEEPEFTSGYDCCAGFTEVQSCFMPIMQHVTGTQLRRVKNEWMVSPIRYHTSPILNDRPAESFRSFFGPEYDAVLDSALPQVVRSAVEGSKS